MSWAIGGWKTRIYVSFTMWVLPGTHRIHGAAIYGNMDPINIPPMLAYIPYMDPMGLVVGTVNHRETGVM